MELKSLGADRALSLLDEFKNFALALYLFIVKFLGFVMRAKQAAPAAPLAPSKEETLLAEIRDLLKARRA